MVLMPLGDRHMPSDSPVILAENLTRVFVTYRQREGLIGSLRSFVRRETTRKVAVDGVSFRVEAGELVGFLGPNGAGKTTTLKLLSGILHPTSGGATVLGHVPWRREGAFLRRMAIVMGQKNQLWWDLPAQDSFLLNRDIYQVPERSFRAKLEELTDLFQLGDLTRQPLRKLSLGERMKCELIGSLLHSPEVLFLDEPTIGLDVVTQKRLREFIREYSRRTGITTILTSHYMRDIEELCERAVIIDSGRIVHDGGLRSLVERHATHKIIEVRLEQLVPLETLARFGEVAEMDGLRAAVRVPRERVPAAAAALLAELPVADIGIEEVTAEEVLRQLFVDRAATAAPTEASTP
jgi:ABC-2 type transport system ATP-binding protein